MIAVLSNNAYGLQVWLYLNVCSLSFCCVQVMLLYTKKHFAKIKEFKKEKERF